jgi:hypothetical protein
MLIEIFFPRKKNLCYIYKFFFRYQLTDKNIQTFLMFLNLKPNEKYCEKDLNQDLSFPKKEFHQ